MNKHTAGPWLYREDSAQCPYIASDKKTMIADINHVYVPKSEVYANAHLIAAAPDMLEALKDMIGILEDMMPRFKGYDGNWSVNAARAAIAKAEGGDPC
jgi:hypothetical protein